MTKKQLILEIEKMRKKMYTLTQESTLFSDEIIEVSSNLDKLLNKYQKLIG